MEYTIEVKDEDKIYKLVLKEPNFDQLAQAYTVLCSGYGTKGMGIPDTVKAGKVLIDLCKVEDKTDKAFADVTLGPKLMLSAAIQANNLIRVFETELKKN